MEGGLRIVYGFLPDLGEEVYGLFTEFYRILGEKAYGLFAEFYRMWRRRLTDCLRILPDVKEEAYDCLRIFTGFGGRGLRIVYGFRSVLEEKAYGLFADFYRMWRTRLADCLRMFTGCRGRGLRIVYGFLPDLGVEAY